MEVVDEEVARLDAMLAALHEPLKNPAPRGKLILDSRQGRLLHVNESVISRRYSADSTLNRTAEESIDKTSPFATSVREDRRLTAADRRKQQRERLRERQDEYNKQEMALGGHYDVFKDPYPEFEDRISVKKDSTLETDEESQVEESGAPAASDSQMSVEYVDNEDEENVPRSSQGRKGEGCSTPRCTANNTLAPLRAIDVSAVTSFDAGPNEIPLVLESKKKIMGSSVHEKKKANSPPVIAASENVVGSPASANRTDHSMDDVLSRMQKTPKQAPPRARRTTLIVPSVGKMMNIAENAQEASLSAEVCVSQDNNVTYTIPKDGTFTICRVDDCLASNDGNNGTYTVASAKDATFVVETHKDDASRAEQAVEANCSGLGLSEEQQILPEAVFAVPVVPTKKGKNASKITVDQREERMNTSQKKNASLLEMMDVDVSSPGRALFAARPAKKLRPLLKTPVRAKQAQNDDAMEVSIVMSDISQQPSVSSEDGSMIDPVTDPRPAQSTPTRAPGFARGTKDTPHSALGKPDTSGISAWNGSRTSVSSPVAMNAEQRKEIIKKSVERLSRPKHSTVCQRAEQRSNSKGTSLSPYVGTMSSSPTIVEPVTPFEPIDPSRMIIPNAEKSGTICRVPRTRRELSSRMSLFKGENEETPKPLRSNLLKRMGDYKPAKVAPEKVLPTPVPKAAATEAVAASMSNAPALDMNLHDSVDENVAVPPPPPPTEADVSCVSSRAPAGRSVASVSPVEMLSPDGEMLLHATRSLSLEDVSPAGNNLSGGDLGETANVWQQNKPQKLLADSVCSLNTPHRAGPELTKRRYFSDSMEESGTAFPDASLSSTSEEDTVIVNDTIEVRPHSRGPKKDEVMILKPREVVHPDPPSTPNVRRSTRNRMKPVREWLGEKPVYAVSPGGSKTLVGVNEVEVREKRWLKVRTANYRVAQQREMQLAEQKRRLREKRKEEARKRKLVKIRELKRRHRRGEDLDTTVDSIVTSSDEEEEDIEAIIHVR